MNNQRLNGKPFIIEAEEAHKNGVVVYDTDNNASLTLPSGNVVVIPPDKQFDLTQATVFGLNERLTAVATSPVVSQSGKTLREEFDEEWEKYSKKLSEMQGNRLDYGFYAYYPERNDLVRFCPPYWHRVVAVASSSKLLADPENALSWAEIRNLFENTTIAVAGCSVGSSVINSIVMDLRPKNIKIADKSAYKMENVNRVRLSYYDMVNSQAKKSSTVDLSLKNKAKVVAGQLYSIDPFLNVHVFEEGVNAENIKEFLDGIGGDTKTDIVVEEIDDPRIKILIREEARKRGLPVIMATDVGSAVQLDILRYDKDKNLPLTWGIGDDVLKEKLEKVYNQAGDKKAFFEFVDALIGLDYRQGELNEIIEERVEIPTSTIIPQLGSTAAMAGGIAAESVARILLGFDLPPRAIINKHTFDVKIYRA
jgi:molybdopterin/thiamine biosynthesis adenylyltransferase